MPKVEKKNGVYVVSNTALENLSTMLGSMIPMMMQIQDAKEKKKQKLQDIVEDLEKRRLDFEKMDPEQQDLLKQTDPAGVAALYDDSRIMQLGGKKVPKGYQPVVPPTRGRTQTETATLEQKLAESRKAKADADAAESSAALGKKITDERLRALSDPKDAIDRFFGKTGKVPSSTDELNAFLMSDDEAKSNYRQKIVGTVEYKQAKADEELKNLMREYQPQTEKEMGQLRAAAEYIAGKTTSMPASLPPSMEKKRQALEERRIRNSEAELGVSRDRLALDRSRTYLGLVQDLVNNGMDPKTANTATQGALASGQWDPNLPIPKDKKKDLDMRLEEAQIQHIGSQVKEAQIMNPQVRVMLDALRLKVQETPSNKPMAPQELQGELNKIFSAAGIQVPPTVTQPSNWQKFKQAIGWEQAPAASATVGTSPTSRAGRESAYGGADFATPDETAASAKKANLTPEVQTQVSNWITQMRTLAQSPELPPQAATAISDRFNRLQAALEAKDEAAIRAILAEK